MAYTVDRPATARFVDARGVRHHVLQWGHPGLVTSERPALVMLHGWMDVAASFQFVVDALHRQEGDSRWVLAPDWRGFGHTRLQQSDTYWFPDYLADLDALLNALLPDQPVDLLGHSMGGNVAMMYAGVRPERIRKLVNLEGFGLPQTHPAQAPARYARWLDELQTPPRLLRYASLTDVADRLRKNNVLLTPERAHWLAGHWSQQAADGQWDLLADPAHKRINPVLYQKDEALACWRQIAAPLLWVEGDRSDVSKWWGPTYPRADFDARLAVVPRVVMHTLSPAGHMLHHDQPDELARTLLAFLGT